MYLYFSVGNGQPRERALCKLYRRTFVPSYNKLTQLIERLLNPYVIRLHCAVVVLLAVLRVFIFVVNHSEPFQVSYYRCWYYHYCFCYCCCYSNMK